QDTTTTTVTSSAPLSVSGQMVTFTATITVQSPGTSTPSGVVQFQVDGSNAGNPVSVMTFGGVTTASFSTATLAIGPHIVTASYSDAGTFMSSSGSMTQTVSQAGTATTLSSTAVPVSGQTVTLTATVAVTGLGSTAAANPTGVVVFFDGVTSIGQGTLATSG